MKYVLALIALLMIVCIVSADPWAKAQPDVWASAVVAKTPCPCGCGCDSKCGCVAGKPCDCGCAFQWYADDDDGCYSLFMGKVQVGYLKHTGVYYKLESKGGKDVWTKSKPPVALPAKKVSVRVFTAACST